MDKIFNDEKRILKDILKEEGRTQVWLRDKLEEYGIKRDTSLINQYCKGTRQPRDEYVVRVIAEILEREFEEVNNCFNN